MTGGVVLKITRSLSGFATTLILMLRGQNLLDTHSAVDTENDDLEIVSPTYNLDRLNTVNYDGQSRLLLF